MTSRSRVRVFLTAVVLASFIPPQGAAAMSGDQARRDVFEVFSPDGTIAQVSVPTSAQPTGAATKEELAEADAFPLHVTGPSENRFDIVIIGDGYTAGQMDLFHQHAAAKWDTIKTSEPFASYTEYFNVWTVDVVSNQSGVDNDPLPGTMKDTALDMQFWCNGTERLLCMNNGKAQQFAQLAPQADQVLGLANSTKYGGAGGSYATSSGGNTKAGQITVHELGHSIGGLADEYTYYYRAGLDEDAEDDVQIPLPYLMYVGSVQGEPAGYNISASTDAQMRDGKIKWWRWLGEPSPDGGTTGTFEGGGYYRYGMYRPSDTSLMRFLGHPYNLPSREKMTQAFYAFVDPIESAPSTGAPLDGVSPVSIEVLQPDNHNLTIDWYLDGQRVDGAHNSTTFSFPAGDHSELKVRVLDETPFVRDPAWISKYLTQELTWSIA